MRRFAARTRPSRGNALGLAPRCRARRAEAEEPSEAPAPPPVPQAPSAPPAPAPAPRRRPFSGIPKERLTLYIGGALVVIIVIVIIILASGSRRDPLAYVPEGAGSVRVTNVKNLLSSPVYKKIAEAAPDQAKAFEESGKELGADMRSEVRRVVEAGRAVVLFGSFRTDRLRSRFEEGIEDQIVGGMDYIKTREIGGREYLHAYATPKEQKEGDSGQLKGLDQAMATLGSGVFCIGRGKDVRRCLKVRAGLYGGILEDENLAAAYDADAADDALVFRLGGKGSIRVLAGAIADRIQKAHGQLKDDQKERKKELETAGVDLGKRVGKVRAAFAAVGCTKDKLTLTVRMVAEDKDAADKLKEQLDKDDVKTVLAEAIGTASDAPAKIEPLKGKDNVLVLTANVTIEAFTELLKTRVKERKDGVDDAKKTPATVVLSMVLPGA